MLMPSSQIHENYELSVNSPQIASLQCNRNLHHCHMRLEMGNACLHNYTVGLICAVGHTIWCCHMLCGKDHYSNFIVVAKTNIFLKMLEQTILVCYLKRFFP